MPQVRDQRRLQAWTVCAVTIIGYSAAIIVRRWLMTASPEAAVWLPACLVAGLLILSPRLRLLCLAACLAIDIVTSGYFGFSWRTFLTFPLALLVTYSTERLLGPALNFADPRRLALFLACSVAPACALVAGAQLLIPAAEISPASAGRWFTGHFLGLAIMVPSQLILTQHRRFRSFRHSAAETAAALLAMMGFVVFILWRHERTGWGLAIFPMATFIAFRYGPVGVSVMSLLLTAVTLLYVYGAAPHFGPSLSYLQTQSVQVPVALLYLTSLPTAGMVAYLQRMHRLFSRRTSMARVARTRADAAARAKGEFLANMSHEIRTPLNGVIGLADALSRTTLDRGQQEMLEMILNSGQVLRSLLSDALDLARAQSGALPLTEEPFDVRATIGAASYLFETLAQNKGLNFDVRFDLAPERQMLGDPLRIRQIVSNLISNAVKFTEQGGVRVETTLRRLDGGRGRLTVAVHDTGRGFDKATQARLFNRFEQGDNSVTRRYGGSGLGLSIVRELSSRMDGTVTSESTIGAGSVFTFEVELGLADAAAAAAASPAAAPRREPEPAPVAGARPRLLLAEDHPVNQRVVQAILGGQFDLTIVGDGQAAVDAFGHQVFDVVLMDTHMPVMDGLSAIRAIRAREAAAGAARTPIISLTADALAEHIEDALHAGADRHLAKPVTAASLFEALTAVAHGAPEAKAAAS